MSRKSIEKLRKKEKLAGYVETSALKNPDDVSRVFKAACNLGLLIKCKNENCEDCKTDDELEDSGGCLSGIFRTSL